jgi:adenosylcobinamide-GDP ribazoletransferase
VVGAGVALVAHAAWQAGALVVAAAAVTALVVVATARRRVGGITGDVLGAVVELTLAAGLTAAALLEAF